MEDDDSQSEGGGNSPGFYQEDPGTSEPGTSEPTSSLLDNWAAAGEAHDAITSEDTYGRDEEDSEEGEEEDETGGGFIDDEAFESGSENGESGNDSDGDDDDDDDEGDNMNSLLDITAVEGSDSDDDDEEEEEDDEDMDGRHHILSTLTFHSFPLLPVELRERIWEFYNPYLKTHTQHPTHPGGSPGGGRILTCVISDGWQPRIIETQVLSTIMASTNAMLAVHRESRDLALKHFPHTLKSGTEFGLIRFHRDRDILFFSFPGQPVPLRRFDIGLLYESVGDFRHLAIDCGAVTPLGDWLASPSVRQLTQRLDTLYLNYEAMDVPSRELRWCFSLPTKTFCVDTEEESMGIGEDSEYTYVWADQTHPDFDKERMIKECAGLYGGGRGSRGEGDGDEDGGEGEEGRGDEEEPSPFELEHLAGCTILPMAEFAFAGGTARYAKLEDRFAEGNWEEGDEFSSDEERSESEPDEYESEGIDDDTIDEDGQDEEDEDDLVVRDDPATDDEEGDGSRPPSLDGGSARSPIDIEDDVMDVAGGSGVARFSSDEEEEGSPPRRGRGGAVAYSDDDDDDSDEEEDEEVPVQRTKRGKRARVIESDSEDGDGGAEVIEMRPRKMARRVPIIVSDDEDEDEDEDEDSDVQEVPAPSRKRRRPVAPASSDEEEDSEESEESDSDPEDSEDEEEEEDAKAAKPQTLAERLRLFRDDNPVPEGEEDISPSGTDEDGPHYNNNNNNYDDVDDDDDETGFEGFDDDMDGGGGYSMGMDTFDAESDLGEDEEGDGY